MIYVFICAITVTSCAYWLASQYFDSGVLLGCYLLTTAALCVLYFLLERRKRLRLVGRVTELFDGGFHSVTEEDELSALERKVVRSLKNASAREAKVDGCYKSIAALVSDISHQCKTPLTSVLMYSELPPSEENSAAVHAQAEKLSFLLDALTKLSRCEGGLIRDNLRPAENPVGALVINALNGAVAAAGVRRIELVSNVPDDLTALFDMRWTTEALFNLLDNAVKYSPEGSAVTVTARGYEMFARIDIDDSGAGIAEDEQTNIWKRFYRGKDVADSTSGVGIGLYLSRLILNGEGGRVSVKSEIGCGSTFTVYLPRS